MKYKFSAFILSLLIISGFANAQVLEIITIAGNGDPGYGGDGFSAPAALLSGPLGVAVDYLGNVYIEDYYNYRIRKVNTSNIITTYAGDGVVGSTGNGSIASDAEMTPNGVAVDKSGNLYISDENFNVVRKVNTLGIITAYAGSGALGYSGDGGSAVSASLSNPAGIALDNAGNLFIADVNNHVIRKVDLSGKITTVAGNDTAGYSGDGGPAVHAELDSPYAVAVDKYGNLFITDYKNNVIRRVGVNDTITTFAGTGVYNYTGDNGPATAATFKAPKGIAVDTFGNLFIADASNNVIRKINRADTITTVVGDGSFGFSGDLGNALSANLFTPYAVAVDVYGSLYIADANNQRVRKVFSPSLGISNAAPQTNLEFYPNPFTNNVTVSGLRKSDKVVVCDLAGRQVTGVWEIENDGAKTIAVNDLSPGMYMLQVWDSNGNKKAVAKLVKE